MSKISHSSNLTRCAYCGKPLDVSVPPAEQFCDDACGDAYAAAHNQPEPPTEELGYTTLDPMENIN